MFEILQGVLQSDLQLPPALPSRGLRGLLPCTVLECSLLSGIANILTAVPPPWP